ncbi:MAG: HAD family hydrolase [Acidobacteria bacterium]|nr:HAD family hydrolase [Acidobacteriota bacterium]
MRRQEAGEARALVLFDIDGTLIRRAGPDHRRALEDAIGKVTGLQATSEGIPMQGMLDGDILRVMLKAAGATTGEAMHVLPQVMKKAQDLYVRRCPDLRRRVCPGVRGTLWRLGRRGAVLGLVTGNLSRIGWKKMERAGLERHFRLGAFAEEGETRSELARLAVAQARREGWIRNGTPLWLVGDHPNDILAARANGLRAVAVGTGVVPLNELASHRPDLLMPDLRELDPEVLLCA